MAFCLRVSMGASAPASLGEIRACGVAPTPPHEAPESSEHSRSSHEPRDNSMVNILVHNTHLREPDFQVCECAPPSSRQR